MSGTKKSSSSEAKPAPEHTADAETFAQNVSKIATQSQEILNLFLSSQQPGDHLLRDNWHISSAFLQLFEKMLSNPSKLWEMNVAFWQDYMALWQHAAKSLSGESDSPFIRPDDKDRRFKDKAWKESIVFDYIKQSYLLAAQYLQRSVHNVDGLDPHTRQKIEFYTRQYVDAMAPSNFLMTNPEVLRATLESGGENLVQGLSNMLDDLKRGQGKLRISMTNDDAFEVGKNLAITRGSVIYQNELMQLIQYEPLTPDVYKTPLLVIPAWINKFYILDLRPENSIVKWALEQGFTVFVISWVNPNAELSKKTFEDYMQEGILAALDAIEKATGEKSIGTVGYCLGGTLLACTLAYLHAKNQQDRIVSATFLTTMTDFKESGELGVFIDEEQLKTLEEKMQKQGYLEGSEMSVTFNLLRANDLIWSFVVNNYLLGKDPFPFDLLYWNTDSTRMPAEMHSFYLRNMYQKNLLIKKGGITLAGVPLDLTTIKTPVYMLSTREDHIAPWKSTYTATQFFTGPIRFVLAASGHIAGVINPPVSNKYCHWVAEKLPKKPEDWFKTAEEHAGSWWPDWLKWQAPKMGKKVPARHVGEGKLKPIEPAPGTYVKVKSE